MPFATRFVSALVSSGAIGAGVGRLGLGRRPTDLRHLQACAAVGQGFLMRAYQEAFGPHGVHANALHPGGIMTELGRHLEADDFETLRKRAADQGRELLLKW